MRDYEKIELVGEGTYGIVTKCKYKPTGQIVAVKQFKDSEEDEHIKKIAVREVRILKKLRHPNIINLIDVFRSKKRLYLVFEYVEGTVLSKLENSPCGVPEPEMKRYMIQLLMALNYCHSFNVVHRDIKPENLLISRHGVLKLCDFGFARTLEGGKYTEYVSTRWYRSPEILLGDFTYDKAIDIWALGCLFVELLLGEPLFPGSSDVDMLFRIVNVLGGMTAHQQDLFSQNPNFKGLQLPVLLHHDVLYTNLEQKLGNVNPEALQIIKMCLHFDPDKRSTCDELINHSYFESARQWYHQDLEHLLAKDHAVYPSSIVVKKRKKEPAPKENIITQQQLPSILNQTPRFSDVQKPPTPFHFPELRRARKTTPFSQGKSSRPTTQMKSTWHA